MTAANPLFCDLDLSQRQGDLDQDDAGLNAGDRGVGHKVSSPTRHPVEKRTAGLFAADADDQDHHVSGREASHPA